MLNIFSSPLSPERMVAITQAGSEDCGAPGDFVSWVDAGWQLHSQASIQMEALEGPCQRESPLHVYSADFAAHSECMQHCEKLSKGRSPPVRSLQELRTIQTELHAITPDIEDLSCMWVSGTDEIQEQWMDFYSEDRYEEYKMPWAPGHPEKNGKEDNCLVWYVHNPDDEAWLEGDCITSGNSYHKQGLACPCQYQQQPLVLLRGACWDYEFDTKYTPKQLASSPTHMILMGGMATRIQYNDSLSQFLQTNSRTNVTAASRATETSYVLGKHMWTVTGDVYDCHKGPSTTVYMKLTGCNPEGEFTCNDGQCVTMEQRCNQIPNCRDESDEVDCKLLILKNNHNKKVPPIVPTGGDNFNQTRVDISISLLKIVSMEQVQHKIDFKFGIILQWKENRVSYHNLKVEESLNALTNAEIDQLWLPFVIYANTDQQEAVQLEQGLDTTIVVSREGDFTRSGIEVTDETEIFEGKDNKLSLYQTYTKSFQCQYNLERYPFDTQVRKSS